jgi:ATP-dependent Clp protease adaptor protein ClpS
MRTITPDFDVLTTEPAVQPARPSARPTPQNQPKILPPHAVILHNDDINTFQHVIGVLKRVFGYNTAHAFVLAVSAHRRGRTVVWSGQKEHAEFKAEQVVCCGADPVMRSRGALPLKVSVEPMP